MTDAELTCESEGSVASPVAPGGATLWTPGFLLPAVHVPVTEAVGAAVGAHESYLQLAFSTFIFSKQSPGQQSPEQHFA